MNVVYDKFQSLQRLKMQDFAFQSVRYEVWMDGKMIASNTSDAKIFFTPANSSSNTEQQMNVLIESSTPITHLINKSTFDIFYTSTERLQLAKIPAKTNVDNMGIHTMQLTIGPTRNVHNFAPNEPYCCSIFLINREIVKVTFSTASPETLIEFYYGHDSQTTEPNALQKLANEMEELRKKR